MGEVIELLAAVVLLAGVAGAVVLAGFFLSRRAQGGGPAPAEADVIGERAYAEYRLGHLDEAVRLAEQALRSGNGPSDAGTAGRLHLIFAASAAARKDFAEYARQADAVMAVVGHQAPAGLLCHLAITRLVIGEVDEARSHAAQIVAAAAGPEERGLGLILSGLAAGAGDDRRRALAEARDAFDSAGDPERSACAELFSTMVPGLDLTSREAADLARVVVDGGPDVRRRGALRVVPALRRQGRWSNVVSILAPVTEEAGSDRNGLAARLYLAEASAHLGRFSEARRWAGEAEQADPVLAEPQLAGVVEAFRGAIAAAEEQHAEARLHYESALATAQSLGLQELAGQVTAEIARLAIETGDPEQARRLATPLTSSSDGPPSAAAADAHSVLASADLNDGDLRSARAHIDTALAFRRAAEDRVAEANDLVTLGLIEARDGHYDEAATCAQKADALVTLPAQRRQHAQLLRLVADLGHAARRDGPDRP